MLVVRKSFQHLINQHYKECNMKKFLIALNIVIWSIVCFEVAHAEPAKKPAAKTATVKKEVKHHKKFDGETMATTKPDTVAPKKKK